MYEFPITTDQMTFLQQLIDPKIWIVNIVIIIGAITLYTLLKTDSPGAQRPSLSSMGLFATIVTLAFMPSMALISSENSRDDNTITNTLRFEGAKQVEMDEDNRHARMVDPHDRVCIFHIDEFTRPGDTAESENTGRLIVTPDERTCETSFDMDGFIAHVEKSNAE